ncbi:MAG: fructose-6-phosphate aldolase, partial [Bdellovibrionales bacterium]|nr:fructose-6-phosphate aldolase [Bdellovibrionales bacterium]
MKFFIDTADIHQIKEINQWFPLDGVTTNPTLVAQVEQEHHHLIRSISEVVKGPVSAEVLSTSSEEVLKEARELAGLHSQVVVKLPLTQQGLVTTQLLKKENIPTNLTLCFSALQALAAARAGATFVSIFVG